MNEPALAAGGRTSTAAVAALVLLPLLFVGQFAPSPPSRFACWDSAGILYIGQTLLRGQEYYRDVWDHKPPLFGYLNAFGLWLGRGSLWAVWAMNVACLAAALALFYFTAARVFGNLPALFGLACFAAALVEPFEFANLTEFYALPLQCAVLFLFAQASAEEVEFGRFALIGVCTGCLALLRPNLVGVSAAVLAAPVLFARGGSRWRVAILRAAMVGVVSTLSMAAITAQIMLQGNFRAMYDAVIAFNAHYSSASMGTRLRSLWKGVREVSAHGAFPVAVFGLLFGQAAGVSRTSRNRVFVGAVTVALAIEMAMSSLSGKGFLHYYMTWCPMLAFLGAYGAALVAESFPAAPAGRDRGRALLACATAVLFGCGLAGLYIQYRKPNNPSPYHNVEALAAYLKQNTSPRDTIYAWGEASVLYVLADRRAAGPHFLNTGEKWDPPAHRRVVLAEVASDLERYRPRFIVDTSFIDHGFPHLDSEERKVQVKFVDEVDIQPGDIAAEDATPIFDEVARHYELVSVPGFAQFRIFRLRPGEEAVDSGSLR